MRRPVTVLRPEPGASATAARVEALGLTAIRLPLFRIVPLAWRPPDPGRFDSLLLTSANAARHAGPALARYAGLPTLAVGAATAEAARAAGLDVRLVGTADAAALLAAAARAGFSRPLHLAGRDRVDARVVAERVIVYASEQAAVAPGQVTALAGAVVLLHSARAAARFASLADAAGLARMDVRLAALSEAVAGAAGDGWARVAVAPVPTDAAMVALGRDLAGD